LKYPLERKEVCRASRFTAVIEDYVRLSPDSDRPRLAQVTGTFWASVGRSRNRDARRVTINALTGRAKANGRRIR
jgi:hypothetical protein